MNTKKLIFTIISIYTFVVVVIYVVQYSKLLWVGFSDPMRPDFVQPYGYFVFGPEARVVDSSVIINWATRADYEVSSIYFERVGEKFPDFYGQDVTVQYDPINRIYNYSAHFRDLGGYKYTYQIWSSKTAGSKQIASPVLDLNVKK